MGPLCERSLLGHGDVLGIFDVAVYHLITLVTAVIEAACVFISCVVEAVTEFGELAAAVARAARL